jgi:hypothetical protein
MQRVPAHIHAVTAQGFELKIFLFILACSIEKAMWVEIYWQIGTAWNRPTV